MRIFLPTGSYLVWQVRHALEKRPTTSPHHGIKSSFPGHWCVLALAGFQRFAVQIKAIEKDDLLPVCGLVLPRALAECARTRGQRERGEIETTGYEPSLALRARGWNPHPHLLQPSGAPCTLTPPPLRSEGKTQIQDRTPLRRSSRTETCVGFRGTHASEVTSAFEPRQVFEKQGKRNPNP